MEKNCSFCRKTFDTKNLTIRFWRKKIYYLCSNSECIKKSEDIINKSLNRVDIPIK
jgi:hypothetical protein